MRLRKLKRKAQPKPQFYRNIHGILLLDKPKGVVSNQVLQAVRTLYGATKAGHTGSLDPLATGLLPICFGEATKIAGLLLGSRKGYEAECRLGVTTSSADADGEVLERRPLPVLDGARIEAALAPLRGRISQIPPTYSAIRRDGMRLYELARRGEAVAAPEREVEVFRLELLEHRHDTLRLLVECGSGTYVRSLVTALGEALGCGAHVTDLRRTWIEPFIAPRMLTPEQLTACAGQGGMAALDALLLPLDAGLSHYPAVRLDAAQTRRVAMGQILPSDFIGGLGTCRLHDPDGALLALGEIRSNGDLAPVRGFNLGVVSFDGREQVTG